MAIAIQGDDYMSQLKPMHTGGDDKGKPFIQEKNSTRTLFVETGFGYKEIASSKGESIGRIVEDYVPPSPSFNVSELKVSHAPSRIHSTGKASYKVDLRIIFPNRVTYSEFLFYSSHNFKFYDERGAIFLGAINDSMEVSRIEGGARYEISLSLICVKKDIDDRLEEVRFTDLSTGYGFYEIEISKESFTADGGVKFEYNHEDFGLTEIEVISPPQQFEYQFRSNVVQELENRLSIYFDIESMRLYSNTFKVFLRAKRDDSITENNMLTVTPIGDTTVDVQSATGSHFALDFVNNAAHAGLVAVLDANGNYVYTFQPNRACSRAEGIAFINRFRKFIERSLV